MEEKETENVAENVTENATENTVESTVENTTKESTKNKTEEPINVEPSSKKNLIIGGVILIIAICLIAYAVANGNSGVEITVNEVDTTYGVVTTVPTEEESAEEHTHDVPEFTQLAEVKKGETIATIETSEGNIVVKFLPEVAPLAVENFLTHAKNGYYDGMVFHRVIDEFVIQTGDPTATGMGGESIWGMPFVNEVSPVARHFNGALAMANSGENTNGSQFYIVRGGELSDEIVAEFEGLLEMQDDPVGVDEAGHELFVKDYYPTEVINGYLENSGVFQLDFGYTVFGQVVEGLEVVESIQKVETDANDKPIEDVIIKKVTLSTY